MNTKLIMTTTSLVLGATGIWLIFAPDKVLASLPIDLNKPIILLVQIMGSLYFGYSMLNWMARANLIGGIYNRPIAIANFTHFLIAGLSIVKALISDPDLSNIVWAAGVTYSTLGILFAVILFRHPVSSPVDH